MKTIKWIQGIYLIALLFLSACSADKVAFGTHTVYGLDIDTQPIPALSIGADRSELVVAPRYDNGAIPPVVASIKIDAGWFKSDVSQVYATGDAADYATRKKEEVPEIKTPELQGKREIMVFGTNTNFGVKASFINLTPKSLNIGYKRQELSIIPVGHDENTGLDTYGSVLAAVDTHAKAVGGVEIGYSAYLATGVAAQRMAIKEKIMDAFQNEGINSFNAYSRFGGGAARDKLSKFWMPDGKKVDPANASRLKTWMNNHGLSTNPGDATMFINSAMFLGAQEQAAKDLGL
jgi:hypothetical protein